MGCFGCFGRRKNRLRHSRRESFQPRLNRISDGSTKDVGLNLKVPIVEEFPKLLNLKFPSVVDDHLGFEQVPKISVIPITDDDEPEKKHSPSPSLSLSPARKKVTFDSNVKTYEHIVVEESIELFEEKKEDVKSRQARCSSEGSDVTSNSSGSYPSNHRYQNCRESDDEEEDVTDCDDESDLDDEDYYDSDSYEDKLDYWDQEVYTEEIVDNVMDIEKTNNASSRDRSGYVNAVLNPIENLSQWKAVKSKGRATTQTQSRKENTSNASSFSLVPQIDNELSSSFSLNPKSRNDEIKKQRIQEVAVDASLSTWLSTSQTTISGCSSVETAMSENKKYSKRVQIYDERPILGVLTTEEIKQFSATNSPRKSPCRSPESPIIGTVGGYWNNHSMATSKYTRSS